MINRAIEQTKVALLPQTRRKPQRGAPAYGGAGAPRAGMRPGSGMPAHRDKHGLVYTYAVSSPEGPLFRAPVRTPREDL
jgi:hypothetical protein